MNVASQWRSALVQQLASVYAANPHVVAVMLGGSTARGHADRYSDIEVGVFWQQPPTDAERQAAASAIQGDLVRLYPYEPAEAVWCDDYMLGRAHPDQPKSGVLVEVVHTTTDSLDRIFDAVLQAHNPDLVKQNVVAGILDSVPLYNPALVQAWQGRIAVYPESLAMAVIKRYGIIDHFWRWEMWLERGVNLMMLYQSYAQVQQQILHLLLGLNRVYYFGFKWLDVVAERLVQQPIDLVPRLRQVYQLEPAAGAHALAALVEETYGLIETQLPAIDVDRLRSIFRYRRPVWDQAPPFHHPFQ